jgi:hypothetical protein
MAINLHALGLLGWSKQFFSLLGDGAASFYERTAYFILMLPLCPCSSNTTPWLGEMFNWLHLFCVALQAVLQQGFPL